MDYNSNRKKLVLPEYGRHIQQMVDHALTIEDREERMRCSRSIISTMGTLFPHLRDVSDFKHKLWDHLAIMADFKLDIDFPYDIPQASSFNQPPMKVPYQHNKVRYMQYGRLVQDMIERAIELENEDEKRELVKLIIGHMKKSLLGYNRDNASDERVFEDLKTLSHGRLQAEPEMKIPEFKDDGPIQQYPSKNYNQKNRFKRKKTPQLKHRK